jgi:multimeric flavodoxin WrbA
METKGTVVGIVGSPNREGRTNRLVSAALDGAARAGAPTECIQMADHVVDACKDCLPWVCAANRKCSFKDESFELLTEKVMSCGALVLGTPIYWWDTSGMMRYFFLKVFRVFARSAPFQGLPAFGIGVAGGTGNGLTTGMRPVYEFFQIMQMRALEPLPVTRFTIDSCIRRAGQLGAELAGMAQKRTPFTSLDERLQWYDDLPYLNLSRLTERRLLADHAVASLAGEEGPGLAMKLVESDRLAAAGETEQTAAEVTRVYDAAVKAFEEDAKQKG